MFEIRTIQTEHINLDSPGVSPSRSDRKNFFRVGEEHTGIKHVYTYDSQRILLLKRIGVMHFHMNDTIVRFTFWRELKSKADPSMSLIGAFIV